MISSRIAVYPANPLNEQEGYIVSYYKHGHIQGPEKPQYSKEAMTIEEVVKSVNEVRINFNVKSEDIEVSGFNPKEYTRLNKKLNHPLRKAIKKTIRYLFYPSYSRIAN